MPFLTQNRDDSTIDEGARRNSYGVRSYVRSHGRRSVRGLYRPCDHRKRDGGIVNLCLPNTSLTVVYEQASYFALCDTILVYLIITVYKLVEKSTLLHFQYSNKSYFPTTMGPGLVHTKFSLHGRESRLPEGRDLDSKPLRTRCPDVLAVSRSLPSFPDPKCRRCLEKGVASSVVTAA